MMSMFDFCEKFVELLVCPPVILAVFELKHLTETLAVLPENVLTSWLGHKFSGKQLKK